MLNTRRTPPEETHLEGDVERVTFHSDETGFCVLRVNVKGRKHLVTVVGTLPTVVPGEWIQADGQWVVNREHGRQFQAARLRTTPPESLEGIERFLGSGLVKGIGPVYAARLVARFGKDIFDVIENRSASLEQVDGIGKVRRTRIKDGWNETRAVRSIMAFLLSHGVTTHRAFRIYRAYGDEAITRIKADPYCLARDIRGIGFKSADQVAARLGIAPQSDLRARAGVEHVLLELTSDGHCACPRRGLVDKAAAILAIPTPTIEAAVDHGIAEKRLVAETWEPGADPLIYLAHLHQAEIGLARNLRELMNGMHPCPALDVHKAIAWYEGKSGIQLAPAQQEALRMALASKVMVLTGGPGVGKTTLQDALIRILAAKKLRVSLCAPTGRAAKRLSEATGRAAKTLHRLLAFDPKTGRFKHDAAHALAGDVFVADEASMLDLPLAHQFVRAVPRHAALLLVGDVDQLPSVGPGMVLRDLIDSGCVPVARLTHVFRQAARSQIIVNAHRVNRGELPEAAPRGQGSDFYFVERDDPETAAAFLVQVVKQRLPAKFGLSPMRDIQVLTPMHRGALGAQRLNTALQDALNPRTDGITRFATTYRVGDKVMQVENNYDKDVFNGDMGLITRIDEAEHAVEVDFDGRRVEYDTTELDELVPSYAITIHKSQGSEYPCVVIPLHTQHYIMLQRNLLYTAITRGRRLVVLVGNRKALAIAVGRHDARQRTTTLAPRLRAEAGR